MMDRSMKFDPDHPHGTTLLARDTPENRKVWKKEEIGTVDVDPNVCPKDEATGNDLCPYYRDGRRRDPRTGLPDDDDDEVRNAPIHMLVASYRDRLCPRTLHNVFRRASNPSRIYVRLLQQIQLRDSDAIDDADCWTQYCLRYDPAGCAKYATQVHTVNMSSALAKGPTDARSKLSAMVYHDYVHGGRDDRDGRSDVDYHPVRIRDFCMQTDSHMDFSDGFDIGLIEMWHRAKNDYAVLSTYVAALDQNNQDVRVVPNLCMVTFTSTIRNWGTKQCQHLQQPKLTNAMWGAGLSFHRCHAELNVPVDPYLDGVFDGEEGSRGIRFFTHGYDVYTPDRVLVTHDYEGHQHNPVVHTWQRKKNLRGGGGEESEFPNHRWMEDINRHRPEVKTKGTPRVNMLLGIGYEDETSLPEAKRKEIADIRNSRYGLGNKRTLEQAIEFTGIDLRHRRMVKNKCGNLKWVPFEEDSSGDDERDYGVSATLGRPWYAANSNATGSNIISKAEQEHLAAVAAAVKKKRLAAGEANVIKNDPSLHIGIGNSSSQQQNQQQQVPKESRLLGESRILPFTVQSLPGGLLLLLAVAWLVSTRLNCSRKNKDERHTN